MFPVVLDTEEAGSLGKSLREVVFRELRPAPSPTLRMSGRLGLLLGVPIPKAGLRVGTDGQL